MISWQAVEELTKAPRGMKPRSNLAGPPISGGSHLS
jgi:hypothetical protein